MGSPYGAFPSVMPETYVFRLERPAQVIEDRSIPRKFITMRLDSQSPRELVQTFSDFLVFCGHAPSTVRDAMRSASQSPFHELLSDDALSRPGASRRQG
jgi:hypothetical protein